jgi:sodium transport system permease protein
MRFKFIWRVAYKELISTVRDAKAFRTSVLMPFILTPLFIIGFPLLFGNLFGGEIQKKQVVGVVNIAKMPAPLKTILESSSDAGVGVELKSVTDPIEAVQNGDVDAALKIPESGVAVSAGGTPTEIQVYAKLSSQKSAVVREKLVGAIQAYSKSLVLQKLASIGLPPQTLEPVKATTVNAENEAEKAGGLFAFIFPMLLFMAILGGASTVAVDSTAGEKERGSLEILLVSPIKRFEVVIGKLLAVTLFALFGVLVQITAFIVTGLLSPIILKQFGQKDSGFSEVLGGNLNLEIGGIFSMLAIGVTLALMLSGILVAVCIYARSYKEAQNYLVPLQLIGTFTSVGVQFGDFIARSTTIYATPIIGSVLGILDVVKGKATPEIIFVIVIANLVFAAATAFLALRNFSKEQVLFRN